MNRPTAGAVLLRAIAMHAGCDKQKNVRDDALASSPLSRTIDAGLSVEAMPDRAVTPDLRGLT